MSFYQLFLMWWNWAEILKKKKRKRKIVNSLLAQRAILREKESTHTKKTKKKKIGRTECVWERERVCVCVHPAIDFSFLKTTFSSFFTSESEPFVVDQLLLWRAACETPVRDENEPCPNSAHNSTKTRIYRRDMSNNSYIGHRVKSFQKVPGDKWHLHKRKDLPI